MSKLIASICRGHGRRFGGNPCEHHWRASAESECKLLRSGDFEEIARQRCTFAMIGVAQKRLSDKSPSLDEREEIDLDRIISRAIRTTPRGVGIIQWLNRFHRYVHDATIDLLRIRREIERMDNCGACTSLTISTPYRCTLTAETKRRADPVCDDYLPRRVTSESLDNGEEVEAVINAESQTKYEDIVRKKSEKAFIEMAGWVSETGSRKQRLVRTRLYGCVGIICS